MTSGRQAARSSTDRPGNPPSPGRSVVPPADQFDVDAALRRMSQEGWTWVAYGERTGPDLLVAHHRWGDHADVLLLKTLARCAAYRAPVWHDQDPAEVHAVTWHCLGNVVDVLRNLLNLPPIDRTWPLYAIPKDIPLPNRHVVRQTIRPPQ